MKMHLPLSEEQKDKLYHTLGGALNAAAEYQELRTAMDQHLHRARKWREGLTIVGAVYITVVYRNDEPIGYTVIAPSCLGGMQVSLADFDGSYCVGWGGASLKLAHEYAELWAKGAEIRKREDFRVRKTAGGEENFSVGFAHGTSVWVIEYNPVDSSYGTGTGL